MSRELTIQITAYNKYEKDQWVKPPDCYKCSLHDATAYPTLHTAQGAGDDLLEIIRAAQEWRKYFDRRRTTYDGRDKRWLSEERLLTALSRVFPVTLEDE